MSSLIQNPWVALLPKYTLLRNDERKARLKAENRTVYDFGIGDPQEETPAFIREALIAGISSVSQYPPAIGTVELREACAQWTKRRFGVTLNPNTQIISSNGSKEAIFHIPHVLLNCSSERRVMVFPDPGFPVYKGSCLLSGGVAYQVTLKPEKNYIFDPTEIPADMLKQIACVWVSYPHNPTGAEITEAQAKSIYEWALKHDIVLLSDECYVDMYFPGARPPVSFLQVAAANNFKNLIAFYSLSKRSGMTGYRSGFVAGDERYIALFAKYRPHAGLGTPNFVQKAAAKAWLDDAHVIERNLIFQKKRAVVDSFLKKNGFEFLPSNATFYVWAKVPKGYKNAEDYAEKLAMTTGIVATPGDALGDSTDTWFRLALVPTVEVLTECLALWQTSIDQRKI